MNTPKNTPRAGDTIDIFLQSRGACGKITTELSRGLGGQMQRAVGANLQRTFAEATAICPQRTSSKFAPRALRKKTQQLTLFGETNDISHVETLEGFLRPFRSYLSLPPDTNTSRP